MERETGSVPDSDVTVDDQRVAPETQRPMPTIAAAVQRATLTVGAADDPLEAEADRVADRVVRSLSVPATGIEPSDVPARDIRRGPAALAREITAMPAARVARRVIQRTGRHFLKYLSDNIAVDVANPAHRAEVMEAWALDQNIYELQNLISHDAEPSLENVQMLSHHGLEPSNVGDHLRSKLADAVVAPDPFGNPVVVTPAVTIQDVLADLVTSAPARITQGVSAVKTANGGAASSELTWFGLTEWGAGMGVTIRMLPGGIPAGSTPASDPMWMRTVEQHLAKGSASTMYVRGHLLNHNIGGPGLDYNMVPITGKTAKNVGGNDANGDHLDVVERTAKDTWDQVRLGHLAGATYTVVPRYNRPPRAETAFVRGEANKLRALISGIANQQLAGLQSLSPGDRQQQIDSTRQANPGLGVDDDTLLHMLAQHQSRAVVEQAYGAQLAAGDPLATAIHQNIDAGVLEASTRNTAATCSFAELLDLVEGNAATWEAEDAYIPMSLDVTLTSTDLQGATTALVGPASVPVRLSTEVANVYFRPFKKSEL